MHHSHRRRQRTCAQRRAEGSGCASSNHSGHRLCRHPEGIARRSASAAVGRDRGTGRRRDGKQRGLGAPCRRGSGREGRAGHAGPDRHRRWSIRSFARRSGRDGAGGGEVDRFRDARPSRKAAAPPERRRGTQAHRVVRRRPATERRRRRGGAAAGGLRPCGPGGGGPDPARCRRPFAARRPALPQAVAGSDHILSVCAVAGAAASAQGRSLPASRGWRHRGPGALAPACTPGVCARRSGGGGSARHVRCCRRCARL